MADLKDDLLKAAMKIMQNPTAQKVMSSDRVQKAVGKAFKAGFQVKNEIDQRKARLAKTLNLATGDDLRPMKRELDRLQRQVSKLKKDLADAEERARKAEDGSSDQDTE